jgi:G3E family GTPase
MARLVPRLDLNIVTGFLGSGKTTLVKRFLARRQPQSTLVIINEYGRESIDDRLALHLESEIQTIADGCLCCTVREDLRVALLQILTRRARGELPALERLVIETSGLADPGPVLGTILSDENLNEYIRIGACITTFDALEGIESLGRFAEASSQLAAADTVALTKTDLAAAAPFGDLVAAIRSVNPTCAIVADDSTDELFEAVRSNASDQFVVGEASLAHAHSSSVRSFSVALDAAVDWATYSVWLTALLNRHGDRILRFKAILAVRSAPGKLVVQGVRHRVYPPSHLPVGDSDDRVSRLVFITDGLAPERIVASLGRLRLRVRSGRLEPAAMPSHS